MIDSGEDYFKEIPNRDRVSKSKVICIDRIGVNQALKFTGLYLELSSLKEVEDPLPFVSTGINYDLLPNTKNEAIKSRNFGYDNGFAKTKEIGKQIVYDSQKMMRKVNFGKLINDKTINVRNHHEPKPLVSHQPARISSFPKSGSESHFQDLNPINETNSLSSSISDQSEVDDVNFSNQDQDQEEEDEEYNDDALILEEEEEEDSDQSSEEEEEQLPYIISDKKRQFKSTSESQYYDEKENIPVKLVVFKKPRQENSLRYSTPVKSSPVKINKRTSNSALKSNLFGSQTPTRTVSSASSRNSSQKPLPYFRYSKNQEMSSVEIDKSFQSFVRPSDVTLRDLLISGVLSDKISIAESDRTSESNHNYQEEALGPTSTAKLKNQRKSNVDASKRHSFAKIIKPDMRIHKFESENFKDSLDYMKQIME